MKVRIVVVVVLIAIQILVGTPCAYAHVDLNESEAGSVEQKDCYSPEDMESNSNHLTMGEYVGIMIGRRFEAFSLGLMERFKELEKEEYSEKAHIDDNGKELDRDESKPKTMPKDNGIMVDGTIDEPDDEVEDLIRGESKPKTKPKNNGNLVDGTIDEPDK